MREENEIIVRSLRDLDALVAEHVMGIKPPTRPGVIFTPARYTTWACLESVIRNREEAGFSWSIEMLEPGRYGCILWNQLLPKPDVLWVDGFSLRRANIPAFLGSGPDNAVSFNIAALASAGIRVKLELGEGV